MKYRKRDKNSSPPENSLNGSSLKNRLGRAFRDWQLYVLLLPAAIYLFIFAYIPMYGVQIAFRDYSTKLGIWGSQWVGLKWFEKFISFPNFKLLLMNTLEIGVYMLATFPFSIIFALMLNELRSQKLKKGIQMISYMPYFLSTVVVCSMLLLFTSEKTGIFNTIIVALGGKPISFMTEPKYFADVYVWSAVWQGLGWCAILYLAALSNVPNELIEAARIDGATRLQIIWHVYIPCIMPTIIIQLIFACGAILGVSQEKVLLLQNDLNISRSQVIPTYVFQLGVRSGQFSYSAAIGLFNNLVSVTVLAIVNRIAKKTTDISIW